MPQSFEVARPEAIVPQSLHRERDLAHGLKFSHLMQMTRYGARLHQVVPVEAVVLDFLDRALQSAVKVREQLGNIALVTIQADELLSSLNQVRARVKLDKALDRQDSQAGKTAQDVLQKASAIFDRHLMECVIKLELEMLDAIYRLGLLHSNEVAEAV